MKRFLSAFLCILLPALAALAQTALNDRADNITGIYLVDHKGEESKVEISRAADGTYTAQVIWVKNRLDQKGNVRLDEKNPDKALRSVPCDEIVLIKGLKYDAASKSWGGTKVYDPVRGLRADVECRFSDDGKLLVKGTKIISITVVWEKLQ